MPVTRYEQIAAYKRRLLDNEKAAMARMTQYAGHTWLQVQAELQHLLNALDDARATGREVSPSWLYEGNRLANLADQIRQNVDAFGQYAAGDVYAQVRAAIARAGSDAADAVRGALGPPPPGISPNAALVGSFGTISADTLDAIAARVAPGSPVDALFQGFGNDAADAASKALVTGVTLGWGPAQIAAGVRDALGVPLSRAMTISRTETLGAYRDATLANYQANSDVVDRWVWVAELGPNTCEVCWAMNGQTFPLDEPMDSHVNCRCSPAPVTKSWDELLGLDEGASGIEENRPVVPNGEEAFAKAPESVQRRVLGPSKFALYATGQLSLGDLVARTTDPTWGRSLQSKPLRDLGFTQRHIRQARERIRRMDLHSAAYRAELLARARGETPSAGFALMEPPTATLTRERLAGKTMAELRDMARDLNVTPARSKAETIDRLLAKAPGVVTAAAVKSAMESPGEITSLRRQVDERMAQRELLYGQQHDLVAEQKRLENEMTQPFWDRYRLESAALFAKQALYRDTLDQSDPAVKQYLKDYAAYNKAKEAVATTKAEQDRLTRVMDRLSVEGKQGGAEYAQARADYDAAKAAETKAGKAETKAYHNLWTRSPGVYKPELDSIAGFGIQLRKRGIAFTDQQIANHPLVVAARKAIAAVPGRIAELKAQIKALDKPIKQINAQIARDMAQLKTLGAALRSGAEPLDTMRPFSDVVGLPEGHQPPNALMNKLDYRMNEPRDVTKRRIINDIADRLKDNPAWQAYVARTPMPNRLGVYHDYIDWHADAKDTKNAALVADWVKKWGVGYKPGSPQWVAMQRAAADEFGLDARIHTAADNLGKGEAYYTENGAALRALMRAMYDNTQQWFAEQGITEIEVYRGFGWAEDAEHVPASITWGPRDAPNYGVADLELNPFQSFSADINVSQGTGAGNGFAGGGFGGGSAYSLLIGAKVPVDRVLATAQTGFGAKLESEIVVMGRATDTVAYRADTRVEAALLRAADERAVSERETAYSLADGTAVRVAANADGTFTLTYQEGPQAKLGTFKVGSSKTYKTEQGVNKALKAMRLSNTYAAPEPTLAVREGEGRAAASSGGRDLLAPGLDRIPEDATVADMQDWVKEQIPALEQVDLMSLDAPTARLVANASANLIRALPEVSGNLWRIAATNTYTDALAMVPRDGLSILLNTDKWTDLAGLAERTPRYAADGWWVAQTPEGIIGHEIGHALQINYHIDNDTWQAAMERVAAAGGNPLVSTYAGNKVEESFAETFALVVYGQPTAAQLPIAREMAELLRANDIDYEVLRAAVGAPPLDLGTS